mmetsp:Transcript_95773/g.132883  ORF Transcript_95773/g.132883 Transcript_95773/m.132883 type:complete len:204 (+) Transcript_95773:549-1160(+)
MCLDVRCKMVQAPERIVLNRGADDDEGELLLGPDAACLQGEKLLERCSEGVDLRRDSLDQCHLRNTAQVFLAIGAVQTIPSSSWLELDAGVAWHGEVDAQPLELVSIHVANVLQRRVQLWINRPQPLLRQGRTSQHRPPECRMQLDVHEPIVDDAFCHNLAQQPEALQDLLRALLVSSAKPVRVIRLRVQHAPRCTGSEELRL